MEGRTPGELVFGRQLRVPVTKAHLFGDKIKFNQNGVMKDATYLLERGTNTAWVLDQAMQQIKLAHQEQIAVNPNESPQRTTWPETDASGAVKAEAEKQTEVLPCRPQRLTKQPAVLQYYKKGG